MKKEEATRTTGSVFEAWLAGCSASFQQPLLLLLLAIMQQQHHLVWTTLKVGAAYSAAAKVGGFGSRGGRTLGPRSSGLLPSETPTTRS